MLEKCIDARACDAGLGAHAQALHLLEWIVKQKGMVASETAILQIGPRATRSRSRRDTALAVLEQIGVVERIGAGWHVTEVQP